MTYIYPPRTNAAQRWKVRLIDLGVLLMCVGVFGLEAVLTFIVSGIVVIVVGVVAACVVVFSNGVLMFGIGLACAVIGVCMKPRGARYYGRA